MRPRLTYANVMVTILAVVVLGGGAAYAATKLAKNSVGAKQIKKNAVTRAKIKNKAVNAAKLDPSVLNGYAKTSELNGFLKAPVGPDQESPAIAAGLGKPTYNVGGAGGLVDCQGTNKEAMPPGILDDIDFESVEFDSGGVAHTEPGAAPNCYNGFTTPRAGKYLVSAFVDWEAEPAGYRELSLNALLPSGACCKVLAVDSREAAASPPTSESLSAVANLAAGVFVFLRGQQTSAAPLKFAGGGFQVAYLGS